jgi:signal peptidase I
MLSIIVVLAGGVVAFLAVASALGLGARWFEEHRGSGRILGSALLICLSLLAMRVGVNALRQPLWEWIGEITYYPLDEWALFVGQIVLGAWVVWLAVKLVLRLPLALAITVSLPVLLLGFVAVLLVQLLINPYVAETQRLHSGSMCPTLLGLTQCKVCPECGGVSYTPWITEPIPGDEAGRCCCCSECWHIEQSYAVEADILKPDDFMVNKLLTPRRWDLVYYRATHVRPMEGERARLKFVKRVIGLPGEEVVIKDGAIWINGERLTPPDDIAKLRFLHTISNGVPILWGSAERPAKLGPTEYFVVGDFGRHSNDSRIWRNQIAGHSPFGLPASHIEGVVDLRFGPLSRWHVFR